MAKSEAKDYTAYVDKAPTALQEHITDWLQEVTEYDPTKARTKAEAFAMGVKLTVALRMEHQKSEANQERLAALRTDDAPAKAKAKKKAAKKAEEAAEELEEAEEEAEEEAPAPKRARKGAPRPAKAAKKTAAKSRRRAAPAEDDADEDEELEAPF
jgi:hypothetical protein